MGSQGNAMRAGLAAPSISSYILRVFSSSSGDSAISVAPTVRIVNWYTTR